MTSDETMKAAVDAIDTMTEADVEGFSFTPLPATPPGVPVPYPNEGTLGRKSGEGQKDFLKITMKEIFISG